MSAAFAFAAALASSEAVPAAPQDADVAQLVRDACVATGMQRDALERLARERRWRRSRTTSDTSPPGGWNLFYRAGGAVVMMSHVADFGAGDLSTGSVCTVSVERATPELEAEVGALAASLGLASETHAEGLSLGLVPMRTWSRLGDATLSYAAAPDGRAAVSLSRQIVTIEPAPASPPGN